MPEMSLQLWFMDEEDMQNLCKLHGLNGHQLCNISLADKEQFAKIVKLESEASKVKMTFMASFFPSFFFVACRLNAVPVPASVWLFRDDEVEKAACHPWDASVGDSSDSWEQNEK